MGCTLGTVLDTRLTHLAQKSTRFLISDRSLHPRTDVILSIGSTSHNREDAHMETNLTRRDSLALKGVAIIIMVIFHCFYETSYYALPVDFSPFTQDFIIQLSWWGKLCVPIFAFISGYGLYLSYEHTKDSPNGWLAKRYVKTFSGYWFIYVPVFVVTMVYPQLPQLKYGSNGGLRAIACALIDFAGLAKLFSTPTLCGAWWYMTAATLFICAVPLFTKLEKHIGWIPILVLLIAFPRLAIPGYSFEMNPITFTPAMFLGMVFAKYGVFDRHDALCAKLNRVLLFVIDTAIMVAAIVVFVRLYRPLFWEYHYIVAPTVFIIYLRRYVLRAPYVSTVLRFFGKHSMNIYLTHMVLQLWLIPEWIYSFRSMWLIPAVLFAVSLVLSIVIEALKQLIGYERFTNMLIAKIDAPPSLAAASE